jgi:hypothetical protein
MNFAAEHRAQRRLVDSEYDASQNRTRAAERAHVPTIFISTVTMHATPKKVVHWQNNDISLSDLRSPSFNFNASIESDSFTSTSSLDYLNSQLISHGYAPSPGLVLDGISMSDQERVLKCLFGLLNQRVVSHWHWVHKQYFGV